MSIVKPSILPGFMELLPEEQKLFDNMKNTIEENFIKYGFVNIDTPLIEKEEILLSKGGGETSKQIYRIDKESTAQALRFDLTVSLARYVAMHQENLHFPFRRYQIGKVYRGERNQKGRYREFYQCDIDIIGNENLDLANDAELPSLIFNIFKDLGFSELVFKINNRKLLQGFLESLSINKFEEVLRTIDKLAKIGEDKTKDLLRGFEISDENIEKIFDFIRSEDSNEKSLEKLDNYQIENEKFKEGVKELKEVYQYMQDFNLPSENVKIDFTITRGLDYYTGTVYETYLKDYEEIGAVCSGGRYDDLANNFTKKKFPGVGLSLGLTRLFYQLNEASLLTKQEEAIDKPILVIPMDEESKRYAIGLVNILRENNFASQVYLENGKAKKKFTYADRLDVEKVIIVGTNEIEANEVTVRNYINGDQKTIKKEELIEFLGVVNEN
ncbi:histidine--tRNA ligase [uncultured Helcococcus sp.]|uniref:histidine--tRNA ligase n=1 Tax=uncultured Helcococcus sp. TaxID=1072508 RepID=UPI0026178D0D|nr:histidine--tRNA ligase [uncultured Helcococcus sp.]